MYQKKIMIKFTFFVFTEWFTLIFESLFMTAKRQFFRKKNPKNSKKKFLGNVKISKILDEKKLKVIINQALAFMVKK